MLIEFTEQDKQDWENFKKQFKLGIPDKPKDMTKPKYYRLLKRNDINNSNKMYGD